jgi:hypothetical protein
MLPKWLARRLLPDELDAGEQAILERLLAQPWPLSRADAFAIAGGSEQRFRRIWRHYPAERKTPVGAPRGFRGARKAPVVPLSKK